MTITWDDLPPRPWAEGVEPTAEALADYLTALNRDQLVWLLRRQQGTWAQESRCFIENHHERLGIER